MALKLCHRIKISIKKTKTQNKPYSFSSVTHYTSEKISGSKTKCQKKLYRCMFRTRGSTISPTHETADKNWSKFIAGRKQTCVSSMKALSALRFFLRNSTQWASRAGTAYFLAVYSVVITVSGPIWTSSEYRNLQEDIYIFIFCTQFRGDAMWCNVMWRCFSLFYSHILAICQSWYVLVK